MLEFIILMVILDLLARIPLGNNAPDEECTVTNGVDEWHFESVDDCMEFRELRKGGWKGNATDFYELKRGE